MRIYTYNDRCVHEKAWDEITLQTRGIIFDRQTGKCIAYPFPKFFNVEETFDTQPHRLPWDDGFQVFQKMDGWLGILYHYEGEYRIATRGSFESPGAQWATQYVRENHPDLSVPENVTLIFEIISKPTKIIVDYDWEGLVLLGAYDFWTGEELPHLDVCGIAHCNDFQRPKILAANNLKDIFRYNKQVDGTKHEGFVVRFNNGMRVKVKSRDYLRRARILSNLTPLAVWETMENGRVPEQYIDSVDPDYQQIIMEYAIALQDKHEAVLKEIMEEYELVKGIQYRKLFAQFTEGRKWRSMMFCLKDGQISRVHDGIKQCIRPDNNVIEELEGE